MLASGAEHVTLQEGLPQRMLLFLDEMSSLSAISYYHVGQQGLGAERSRIHLENDTRKLP